MVQMQRRLSTTPCPVAGPLHYRPRDSILSVEDTTTNLDYTTDFGNSLNAKPRRRLTGVRPSRPSIAHFTIHEDEEGHLAPSVYAQQEGPTAVEKKPLSNLARPPQRLGRRVSFAATHDVEVRGFRASTNVASMSQILENPPQKTVEGFDRVRSTRDRGNVEKAASRIRKPARRGTIYIPSEDTTMPSIYMGIFSPVQEVQEKVEPLHGAAAEDFTGIAGQMAKKKGPRKSLVTEPPKRGPLQTFLQPLQEEPIIIDTPGQQTGKENVPPSFLSDLKQNLEKDLFDLRPAKAKHRYSLSADNARRKSLAGAKIAISGESTSADGNKIFHPKAVNMSNGINPSRKPVWNSRVNTQPLKPAQGMKPPRVSISEPEAVCKVQRERVPTRFVVPRLSTEQFTCSYPLLGEDISNPEMYEENWLSHQEIAITQLVNKLFAASRNREESLDDTALRIRFLETYQEPPFGVLYKRLQASLLYGALSIPKEILGTEAVRLRKDIGARAAFLNLWLHTFELNALRVALEVVVGRKCKMSLESVKEFLYIFLIRNEDAQPESGESQLFWSYRRTFLRSLMVVRLIDQVKTQSHYLPDCLFLSTSPHKSLSSFIQSLCRMLNPSVGDALRALAHIDYHVNYSQYPLEEYDYCISNLAVDLRDGICLTRLVELLLYPSACPRIPLDRDSDATTVVMMPTGEVLSLTQGPQDWPLSQHLKFPCLGRATKLYNVQVALSALQGVSSVRPLVQGLCPEDIVDGFREKTVALLWGLVGKWGLGGLIDWNDVSSEISKLSRHFPSRYNWYGNDEDLDLAQTEDGFETHKAILKQWARAVAATRGLQVTNLTSSFADGKVFEALVDKYEPYVIDTSDQGRAEVPLHRRLLRLGCNNQFAQLFEPAAGSSLPMRIFDRDFTLASLAFLCSRLLSASKRPRAATVIQRAWRRHWAKVERGRRLVRKQLAETCAQAVAEKDKRLWAKNTIWQAWKEYSKGNRRQSYSRAVEESELDVWLTL